MKKTIFFYCLSFTSFLFAQIPDIEVKDIKNHSVTIQEVIFETQIFGNLAETRATYTFYNSSSVDLEGTLTFPLPDGASVIGYSLDINGKLREAVPVAREKAKEVFENIARKNIDPGIIEKLIGNNFRTRIYPIPANGKRTIQIVFNQELKTFANENQFVLSFANGTNFKNFYLKTSVNNKGKAPTIIENPSGNFSFENKDNLWVAEINKTNFSPNQNLKISIPNTQISNVILQPNEDGKYYFASHVTNDFPFTNKEKSSKVGIIWDNSFSGSKRNIEAELQFLSMFFKDNPNVNIQFYLLNISFENLGEFNISNGDWSSLREKIINLKYDGATDFDALKEIENVDEYLLFSDGMSNFGDLSITFKKPLNSITSATISDFNLLKLLAHQSGGNFINLNEVDLLQAFKIYKKQPLKFLGFKEKSIVEEIYPAIGSVVDSHIMLYGIVKENTGKLTAIFEGNKKQKTEFTIDLNTSIEIPSWDISKNWAQRKINELETSPARNRNEIRQLSQKFGIVSKNTSLIVLENIEDYVLYKIVPPEELLSQYNELVAQKKKTILGQRRELLSKAFNKSKELQVWWNMEFQTQEEKKIPKLTNQSIKNSQEVLSESIVVNNGNLKEEANRPTQSGGKINLIDVESNEEYTVDFKNLESDDVIYQKYLELRPKYQYYPSFYFDVSKLLFKKNKLLSLKVLSTLAELDIENEELYKTIYYLLKQRGFYEKELWITQKILEWRPFDIQSHRDYAQSLLDIKKPQEALEVYKSLLYYEFSEETSIRDEGIEEILIMEINNILSLNKNIDASSIDNRLKANLPVDIRVVINWNKDHTDIDLHIVDPNNEECFYQKQQTSSGGRLSNDFTDGFGPEQFLLKKAAKGKYKIKTNYFGDRQMKLSGPTTIMAEVFLYYSDGRQERKIAVFQIQKSVKIDKDGMILIGEFQF